MTLFTKLATLIGTLILLFSISTTTHAAQASWYGPGFHGKTTASGEKYNMNELTAAHKTLGFGSKVKVTNLKNNKSVIVRINDRGPYHGQRIIDLSKKANKLISCDLCPVKMTILEKRNDGYKRR